jgi:hypothetical protein
LRCRQIGAMLATHRVSPADRQARQMVASAARAGHPSFGRSRTGKLAEAVNRKRSPRRNRLIAD